MIEQRKYKINLENTLHDVTIEQAENGMYIGEIREKETNLIESGTVKKTLVEIWRWLDAHEKEKE